MLEELNQIKIYDEILRKENISAKEFMYLNKVLMPESVKEIEYYEPEYTEGLLDGQAVILKDGSPMAISEILEALNGEDDE